MTGSGSLDVPELNNLITFLANGVSSLYNPFFRDPQRIKNMKLADDLEVSYVDGDFLLNKAPQDLTYVEKNEFIKFQNSTNIIFEALEKIQKDLESGKYLEYHKPDDDWSTIFLENSQFVSNDELRKLWSELLKKELTSENNGSKRTLDILKSLSINEVNTIKELRNYLCTFVQVNLNNLNDLSFLDISHPFLLEYFDSDIDIPKFSTSLNYTDLQQLSSIGIYNDRLLTRILESNDSSQEFYALINGELFLVGKGKISIECFHISNEGLEIFNLIDEIEQNETFLRLIEETTEFKRVNKDKLKEELNALTFNKN